MPANLLWWRWSDLRVKLNFNCILQHKSFQELSASLKMDGDGCRCGTALAARLQSGPLPISENWETEVKTRGNSITTNNKQLIQATFYLLISALLLLNRVLWINKNNLTFFKFWNKETFEMGRQKMSWANDSVDDCDDHNADDYNWIIILHSGNTPSVLIVDNFTT